MKHSFGWYAVAALYGLALAYYAYRALEEYGDPLRGLYEQHRADVQERAKYRAAVQQTLAAIRQLPEAPRDGRLRAPKRTGGPGAGA